MADICKASYSFVKAVATWAMEASSLQKMTGMNTKQIKLRVKQMFPWLDITSYEIEDHDKKYLTVLEYKETVANSAISQHC